MQRGFCLRNVNSDEFHNLDKPSMLIGRSPQCDIFVDSTLLSRHHASLIFSEQDSVLIKDLESTNGTFVNSMRVKSTTALEHNDVITIGDAKFIFIDLDKESENNSLDDLYGRAKGYTIDDDPTYNRTMVQSSIFKSLGLDPATLDFDVSTEDDSLMDISYGSVAEGKLDIDKIPGIFIIKSGRKRGAIIKLALPALSEKTWSVGRSQLSDVVLDDPTVSSNHATIRWSDGNWFIQDCGSTNGVKLNGVQIQDSSFLNDDVISIGSIKLLFKTTN